MIICRCNEVSLKEIEKFMLKYPNVTLGELIENTRASTNCGRCSVLLKKTFDKIKNEQKLNNQLRISF